jgi:hypothetical protein
VDYSAQVRRRAGEKYHGAGSESNEVGGFAVSIEAMTWVLRHSEETLGRRLVLLALANYAHADGSNAFPSVGTLAEDTRMSERQVQRALRGMEADASIGKAGKSVHGTTIWTIRMTGGDILSGVTNQAENRPEMSPNPSVDPSVEEELRSPSSFEIAREAFSTTSDQHANGDLNDTPGFTTFQNDGSRAKALSVDCPRCDAEAGARCEGLRDTREGAHRERHTKARGGKADKPSSGRQDVDTLCMRLAALMLANDPKARIPKTVAAWKRWQDAARLLIDADERHYEEADAVLEFSQADEFWKGNILSMPKFREKYPQLRQKWIGSRQRVQAAVATSQQPTTADLMAAYERRDDPAESRRRRAGVR